MGGGVDVEVLERAAMTTRAMRAAGRQRTTIDLRLQARDLTRWLGVWIVGWFPILALEEGSPESKQNDGAKRRSTPPASAERGPRLRNSKLVAFSCG